MAFPPKIVLATGNMGKVREFESLFASFHASIIPQKTLGVTDADETGTTFIENAIIKARHAAKTTGLPAIADDSGLVVDALGGAPGIYSSRYAGENASDNANINKLLAALDNTSNRRAYFVCTLVFMRHADDPTPVIAQGKWHGEILPSPCGEEGFGYDPVFYIPELGLSAAQLDKASKNRISHRGQALSLLLSALESEFA